MVRCSGTLIAPDVVLTAAHCVTPTMPDAIMVGAVTNSGTRLGVREARAHPQFDELTLDHDIGTVSLDGSTGVLPATAAAEGQSPLLAANTPLTAVGFGAEVSSGDTTPPRRRTGGVVIDSLTATSFMTHPAPAQPCGGDSGGAAFIEVDGRKVLVGVVSAGDVACSTRAQFTRVDTTIADLTGSATTPPVLVGGCSIVAGGGEGFEHARSLTLLTMLLLVLKEAKVREGRGRALLERRLLSAQEAADHGH